MAELIFDEQTMLDGNIFKFEQRLLSQTNKYIENGAILTTYFSQDENASTVDRGLQDIEELFGNHAPLRYNEIKNFPVYGLGQVNPDNTDEQQIEDIHTEGDCIILPATIVPRPYDCFVINHLKMKAVFQVTTVTYDSMKVEGFYKIHYRLLTTSTETLEKLQKQVIGRYNTELNAIGTGLNPIVQEDDYAYRKQVQRMVNVMINSYRSLYYNQRHNCFLYHHPQMGLDWFDHCGNEFIGKHGLMNIENSPDVIMVNDKLRDIQFAKRYNQSIFNWIEIGAPKRMLQNFHFLLTYASTYPTSSFALWNEGNVQVMNPLALDEVGKNFHDFAYFDDDQLNAFLDDKLPPFSEYEKLIWKYIHQFNSLNIRDVSLFTADTLLSSSRSLDTFLYTPIIIYIIRKILRTN